MKRFIQIYLITVIFFLLFSFFGGYVIFDLNDHFWVALLARSFVLALVINAYICQVHKREGVTSAYENVFSSIEETEESETWRLGTEKAANGSAG